MPSIEPEIEFVRVKDKANGHESSIVKSAYEADPTPYDLLDKPAVHSDGTPLPPKHHITLPSTTTKAGRQAAEQKEND